MENLSEMLKGILEGIVLEVINRGETYGYEIVKQLDALGFRDIAEGTVYALLVRIEKKRWVDIEKKPSELGPPRKFYTLNQNGLDELKSFWARWNFLNDRMNILKNGGNEK